MTEPEKTSYDFVLPAVSPQLIEETYKTEDNHSLIQRGTERLSTENPALFDLLGGYAQALGDPGSIKAIHDTVALCYELLYRQAETNGLVSAELPEAPEAPEA